MGCGVELPEEDAAAAPMPGDVAQQTSEIIGGVPTTETPAVVALFARKPGEQSGSLCTATVVAPTVLLTAAHCVHPSTVGTGVVFSAYTAADITNPDTRGPGLPVREVHWDPEWSQSNLQAGHDIAVAILQEPIGIAPIPVNTQPIPSTLRGAAARIIGYGLNDGVNQTGAGVKRHATVRLNSFNTQFVKTGSWFGKTICNGDSGGPILVKVNGVETIFGVNSFGFIYCIGEASSTRPDANMEFLRRFLP